MSDNKEKKNEEYEKQLQELNETYERRKDLDPKIAKKVLIVAIIVFVILCAIAIPKWMAMFQIIMYEQYREKRKCQG